MSRAHGRVCGHVWPRVGLNGAEAPTYAAFGHPQPTGAVVAFRVRQIALELRCRTQEAVALVERACACQGVVAGQLTLGTDNGSAFTSRGFRACLRALRRRGLR